MKTTKPEQDVQPDQRRRKLFRGVSGGVGVLMAVQAKTALGAGVCASPSAILSGNTSPRPGTGISCAGGNSPGYWKQPQNSASWPAAGAVYPTFTGIVIDCATSNGVNGLTLAGISNQGTTLDSVGFTGVTPSGLGLWAALTFYGSNSGGQLLRHLVAAWLNAGLFTSASYRYPLSRTQIIEMWNATKNGGFYCPTGISCNNNSWSGSDVKAYIEGMYHINTPEINLCLTTQP